MSVGTTPNRPAGDHHLAGVALLAVACLGLAVIAGWHLRMRPLVQIVPGTIPMQYNTALCFALLGLGGLWLVARRRGHVVPVLCGAFVSVMGVLVVFQYLTGTSIGIDTALFFPWERTLSAHPGRMAMTSAISFACAGATLAALSLTRRALAAFAVLNLLPLSFSLTSVLGYAAGITYVLPFNLGSQMAVHTALAFFTYAGAMLSHAWRVSPRTEDGLPRWYPAVALLTVPLFLIGFDAVAAPDAAPARGAQLLLGLACAGALGLLIKRVTRWRVARKGLVLISVPLVFLLAFLVLVSQVKRSHEQAHARRLHSKEVIAQTEAFMLDLMDAQSSTRGYVITGDPAFSELYKQAAVGVPEKVGRLRKLVREDSEQEGLVAGLEVKAAARMALLAEIEQLVTGGAREEAAARVREGAGHRLMGEIRHEARSFLQEQERRDAEQQRGVEASWQRFDLLLATGTAVVVLLTLMLVFLFSHGISRRLSTLSDNARRLADGRELAAPLRGSDEIAHLDRVFHDMARDLGEAARKERAIVENSLDVICAIDEEGKFVKVSPASDNVWGYRPEELTGKPYIEMVAPEDVEKTNRAALEVMAGSYVTDFENCYRRKDGSLVNMMWSASWSGAEKLMYCVARDITERKRTERLVEERKLELEKMASSLTAANKELEAFSYSVSHDLRAPLRAVDGFSRILLEDYEHALDDDGRRVLGVIRSNTQRMGQLIDDLLAFSRLGRKQVESVRVDMAGLARDASAQAGETAADGRPVRWEIGPLPEARGDRAMLAQVFVNLLSNAAKYTRPDAPPSVEVGGRTENGDNVYFVRDNGVGFDMRYAHKLFGVFQRLHSAEEFEGTGVGLAIVKRVVERHGGRVWAEGELNRGATFYFALPRDGGGGDGH